MDAAHKIEIRVGEKKRHQLGLFHADAVLAGKRAADFHAIANDFGGGLHGAFELAFVARVVKNDGMKVAIASVKNIANVEAVARADFADMAKRLWKFGARNDAVKDVVAGGEAAESAKSVFAAFPQKFAFGIVPSETNFARVVRFADVGDRGSLCRDSFRETFDFEKQHGGAIARETGVNEVFDDAKGPAIEHFASGGNDGARGDVDDGFGGIVDGIENCELRFDGFRLAREFDGNFGNQSERAFGTNEKAGQVVAGSVALRATDANNFAVREDQFECGHVIGGDAVSERVRATGIFRHIAADRAGFLAGGIGCKVEAVRLGGKREVEIDDAGLHHGALIFRVDRENAIHARENDHDATDARERSARKAGAGAAADDGDVVLHREFDDLRDLLRGGGKDDDVRATFFDRPIVLVEQDVFRLKQNGGRTEKLFEIAKKASVHSERLRWRIWHYSEISRKHAT